MSIINRHNIAGTQNSSNDTFMKVETHPNSHISLLNVYSEDRLTNSTYASASYSTGGEILTSNINKLALFSYDFRYCISNINARNNVISFMSSNTGPTVHSVTLTSGHYTRDTLMAHITFKLDTLTGVTGLTFTAGLLSDCVYLISSAGGDFRFVSSSHMDRAAPCSGLIITASLINSMVVTVGGQYTNYIDVTIDKLRDAQIIGNSFTKDNVFPILDHMFRIPISQPEGSAYVLQREQLYNLNYVSIRNKQLTTLNIALYDQFGELIFSPIQPLGNDQYNIPLITYEMKFTMSA